MKICSRYANWDLERSTRKQVPCKASPKAAGI